MSCHGLWRAASSDTAHTDRNLQAAVGAYYDFYGPVTVPTMSAKDVTLSPGQPVPPNTALSKVWRVTNTGIYTSMTLLLRAKDNS